MVIAVLDPNPRGVGKGVRKGGGADFFRVFRAFINSWFHSEHFEYIRGAKAPYTLHTLHPQHPVHNPDSRSYSEVWESLTQTRGVTLTCGSP